MKKTYRKFVGAKRRYAVLVGIIAAIIISFLLSALINLFFFYSL